MDSNYKKILDRIDWIVWIEGPSAGGHLACRRQKNLINPACRVEAFSEDYQAGVMRSEDW